ncbi:hypothetical protein [Bacillus atrophaeus]|uniref:hypothetical protein n=1 Tax=Bacillus atrophaeus TaxID=1452 RepID=UPI00227E78E9|nr:hypothetical protein [Bacillus atrophaeus]MCY9166525.1 hypothetical protein [Bacillus atrophaeus]
MLNETRKIKWEYEDNLEIDITTGMYIASKVIWGVRMYPYVEVGVGRYYIESDIEDTNN